MDARVQQAIADRHERLANGWTPSEAWAAFGDTMAQIRTQPPAEATPVEAWAGGPR